MTTALPSPRIPQELCEQVIACLTMKYERDQPVYKPDRNFTLRQCALVCKAWLPSTRSRIFSVANLSNTGAEKLRTLLRLNPILAQYMAKVIVHSPLIYMAAPLELVAELSQKLTAVKELLICGHTDSPRVWEHMDSKMRQLRNAILPMLQAPTLDTVVLKDISFTTEEQFRQFVSAPSLATLTLDNVHISPKSDWTNDERPDYGTGCVPTMQRRLAISTLGFHSQDAALRRWLLHRDCPVNVSAISELSIRPTNIRKIRDSLPLLNAIGDSLNVLGVWLPPRFDFQGHRRISKAIPALPNTHIEHISISVFDRQDPPMRSYRKHFDGAEFVKGLLLRLPAPQHLRTVTINEDVDSSEECQKLEWRNWRELDRLLAQDSFSNVQRLDFFSGLKTFDLDCDDVRSCIIPQFRAFQERRGTVFTLTVEYTTTAWYRKWEEFDSR
ncbi:hypothetical protein B0H11DRAFT_2283068, partial [Mycena galericulata]